LEAFLILSLVRQLPVLMPQGSLPLKGIF
jgi:hypothetical protein